MNLIQMLIDLIYVVGGNDGNNILDTMEMYDFVLK